MKMFWLVVKVVLGIVLVIPLSLIALGLFGTVLGIAVMPLRLALLGLLAYGAFRLVARLLRGPAKSKEARTPPPLRAADPLYDAAMKELDRDLAR